MTDIFGPKDGVKSRKQHCIELIQSLEPGAQIPVSEIQDLCDCSYEAAYGAMRSAAEWLELNGQQSVETRRGFGWEVIDTDRAMLNKAGARGKKMLRAGGRAAATTNAVDRDKLDRIGQQELDRAKQNLARVAEIRGRKPRSLSELAKQAKELGA